MDKQKTVWADCWSRIQEYLAELARYHADKTNMLARQLSRKAVQSILELLSPEMELSAVARACVLSSGDKRVINLLQIK